MAYQQQPPGYGGGYGGQPPQGGSNPGQVMGIVSIVLGVTGCLAIVGLVLGFVSRSRSKRAGAPATLGTVGIVVSAIAIVLGLVFGGLALAGVGIFGSIIDQCNELGPGVHEVDGVTYTCS